MEPRSIRRHFQHKFRFRNRFLIIFLAPTDPAKPQKVCSRLGAVLFFIYLAFSFLNRFGTPKTSKIGAQIDHFWVSFFDQIFECIFEGFGVDFGSLLGGFLMPKSVQKRKSQLYENVHPSESILFEVWGGPLAQEN